MSWSSSVALCGDSRRSGTCCRAANALAGALRRRLDSGANGDSPLPGPAAGKERSLITCTRPTAHEVWPCAFASAAAELSPLSDVYHLVACDAARHISSLT